VLSYVQFGLVLIASLYLLVLAMITGALAGTPGANLPVGTSGLAVEALVLAAVQVAADVVLLVAAIRATGRRTRRTWRLFTGALLVHVVLAGYWIVRLIVLRHRLPGDISGLLSSLTGWAVLFAGLPLVALGLVGVGPGRRWFTDDEAAATPARG
jgi:hypothetical protein